MATYQELFDISNDTPPALAQRIRVAIKAKAADIVNDPASTTALNDWARQALRNPDQYQQVMLNYLLGTYREVAVGNITGADDETVQTAVNDAVTRLLGVDNGEG